MADDIITDSTYDLDDGIKVIKGNMKVTGNLEVNSKLTTSGLKVMGDTTTILSTTDDLISFKQACNFTSTATFNGGKTIIGREAGYGSACISTQTLMAGDRLIIGDSCLKIESETREILADTFQMNLSKLIVDTITTSTQTAKQIDVSNIRVTHELIGKTLYSDILQSKTIKFEKVSGLNVTANGSITTKDLLVNGGAIIKGGLSLNGAGTNSAALTVNGGEIIANNGIVSYTRNNLFQTMQIIGSGKANDPCFRIDPGVASLVQGDVTIQDSDLILDNSRLVSDNIVVTPLDSDDSDIVGVQLTTSANWDSYENKMVTEVPAEKSIGEDYDPYSQVAEAIQRNISNYDRIEKNIKSILNPINYAMENSNKLVPKKFTINKGVYRMDSNGNAMFRNVVSEIGTFSTLNAFNFNVNKMNVDKLVTTSVASNVVHTDNLLKSEGIAEFDGVVNTAADIFVEEGSNVDVAKGCEVTFQDGAALKLKSGAKFEMGNNTSVKMSGDIEIDVSKLVFTDDNGNKYRIGFKQTYNCDGTDEVVMEYYKVDDSEPTTEQVVETTERSVNELSSKLKSLGL